MSRSRLYRNSILAMILLSGLAVTSARGETLTVEFEFSPRQLIMADRDDQYSLPQLPGCTPMIRVGGPALPTRAEQVVLPQGMRAVGLTFRSLGSVRIPCGMVSPAQSPAILGTVGIDVPTPAPVTPDPDIYDSRALYPAELALFRGTGRMRDLAIASFELRPLQYDPAGGELILHTRILVDLELEPDPDARRSETRPSEMGRLIREIAADKMGGDTGGDRNWHEGTALLLDPGDYQYLIITEESQLPAYEAYAAWKTAKGVPATTVTIGWISANYSGRDLAEKIRNFVIEATGEWGLSYLLIGGDEHIVPSRVTWAFDCEADFYDDENDLYADLYYADHDGDWDANGNDIFGEVDDDVDLYPEILVGRSPSENLAEAWNVVNKFLVYEKTPPVDDRTMEAFFFAEVLWTNPYTDSGVGKDMIADRHFGPAYDPIERQYESLGNESPTSVFDYLSWGPHLVNHAGHANYAVMGAGDGYIYREDVINMTNAPHFHVIYSIGCWSAAFDYDCIAERFIADGDNGGAIAFVGNSRYGWGSPGNPGWGYSETFDSDFYGCLVNSDDLTQFGAAVAWPKIARIPFSREGNVYRWHEYQVNLLGDPEMTVHTAPVSVMNLSAPATIPLGATVFTARVSDTAGPLEDVRLCLAGDDIYMVGFSDAAGRVSFGANPVASQVLTLTASGPNHPYFQTSIIAAGDDPFPVIDLWSGNDDDGGNGDGMLTAGETVQVTVMVRNRGGQPCINLRGGLSGGGDHVSILSGEVIWGDIPADGVGSNLTPLSFSIDGDCPMGEVFPFDLQLTDDSGGSWTGHIFFNEMSPDIRFDHYSVTELTGNGDGRLDKGETGSLTVYIQNRGLGFAPPMSISLSTSDFSLNVLAGNSSTSAALDPGESAPLDIPFEVMVENWAPAAGYGDLDLDFAWVGGTSDDNFLLAFGALGFEDDMESGTGGWTHSGANDDWHLETYRSHSGNYSWYCGTAGHTYQNDTNATLFSPEFVVAENTELSFQAYFDVTIYGTDGLFVEVLDGFDWERIDYLGSGGALDSLLFVCGWAEHRYDLDFLTPGAISQLRFRFESDGADTAEGYYIDDISISPENEVTTAVPSAGQIAFSLSRAWPNPLVTETRCQLSLPRKGQVDVRVYDPSGRQVRNLYSGNMAQGSHTLVWDGRTDGAQPAAAGVYFIRVRTGEQSAVSRMLLLR
jgi:hypothetical protein